MFAFEPATRDESGSKRVVKSTVYSWHSDNERFKSDRARH
jgi:hypothetical protein